MFGITYPGLKPECIVDGDRGYAPQFSKKKFQKKKFQKKKEEKKIEK